MATKLTLSDEEVFPVRSISIFAVIPAAPWMRQGDRQTSGNDTQGVKTDILRPHRAYYPAAVCVLVGGCVVVRIRYCTWV